MQRFNYSPQAFNQPSQGWCNHIRQAAAIVDELAPRFDLAASRQVDQHLIDADAAAELAWLEG